MTQAISLTYFSDVLCIWAYISQARIDEVSECYPDDVAIDYRFCSVFGDTAHKIGTGWSDRGSYSGFRKHVLDSAASFEHIELHPDIWERCRPASSTPAHLALKAVQMTSMDKFKPALNAIRSAFFEHSQDISRWAVLRDVLQAAGVSVEEIKEVLDAGVAHAALEADHREQQSLMVQGSPTYILNEGRQKLYGNVGYGVIEANIKELLRSPVAGAASWC